MTDPASFATADRPIVVIGAPVAGMAVAARLAHRGHHVVLLERSPAPGRRARTTPPVIDLPAVWRDLFTKSGRALDAVLRTRGVQWSPAPPTRHRFDDGTEVAWPTNRGDQLRVITDTWGAEPAARWATLMDGLGAIWQRLRPLGLETDTTDTRWRSAARGLVPPGFTAGASIADLAGRLQHPALAALVTQVAWQLGQDPVRLPAHHGYRLATARTFGRWLLTDDRGSPQPAALLVDLLTERLRQRGVDVRCDTAAEHLTGSTVTTTSGVIEARAVIGALPPDGWAALTRPGRWRTADRARRRAARAPWAIAPRIASSAPGALAPATEAEEAPVEIVDHPRQVITWQRPDPLTANWPAGRPDPHAGPAWQSARTWYHLSGPRIGPYYTVGPHTRAGAGVTGELLSAALAAYAVHADLTGEDIHPSNRDQPPRPRRRPNR